MPDPLTVGIGLLGLFVAPFVTYGLLQVFCRIGRRSPDRESTVPSSTTGICPSRTMPGASSGERN